MFCSTVRYSYEFAFYAFNLNDLELWRLPIRCTHRETEKITRKTYFVIFYIFEIRARSVHDTQHSNSSSFWFFFVANLSWTFLSKMHQQANTAHPMAAANDDNGVQGTHTLHMG